MPKRALLGSVLVSTFVVLANPALAADTTPAVRPSTIAEVEIGVIALPNAPLSTGQHTQPGGVVSSNARGDANVEAGLHLLYRGGATWAIGAGFMFSPRLAAESEYGGIAALNRTHGRSYLSLTGEARFSPFRTKVLETWLGALGGMVIVADRYVTVERDDTEKVPSILGTREVTVRTEGLAVGISAGAHILLSQEWVLGLNLRATEWILPKGTNCTPIGDCATLTGNATVFEAGLSIGFRLRL